MTTSLVRTRHATVDDVPAVLEMHERCSLQTLEHRFHVPVTRLTERLVRSLVTPPHGWSIVAEQGDEVVGHACAAEIAPARVEVGLLVDDAFAGTGIGTRLMRELAVVAASRGYLSMLCAVEPDNESVLPTVRRAGLEAVTSYVDGVIEIDVSLHALAGRRTA